MRWGILANLATIVAVSGVLLFLVFSASLERSSIDLKVEQAGLFADLLESRIRTVSSTEPLWAIIRNLCKTSKGNGFIIYDASGNILGRCGTRREFDKPDTLELGRRTKIVREKWPSGLLGETNVVVDVTAQFPRGIRTVRGVVEIPSANLTPAWKFFALYLILTQGAIFFLGYYLFHRTVIGPVREAARIAGQASGIADFPEPLETERWRGDIQKISSSLRGMIVKILEDRTKMQDVVEQLQSANRDLEAAQQSLMRSEKLALIGRLAAGLAHEIGNPLQILMGYVELLQRGPDRSSEEDILARMDRELRRIHQILQHLLEFARPISQNVVACDLNALLKDCESLVKGRKGFRAIEFEYIPEEDLPLVETEPEKIRQVIVNLIFNAADAIPDSGGRIILTTRRRSDGIEIEVKDTGSGIPKEDLDKVFDPFFTTKEAGKGTGLGLAVCLGLTESIGGSLSIQSVHNQGTAVVLKLPVAKADT